jgi:amino acid transporter
MPTPVLGSSPLRQLEFRHWIPSSTYVSLIYAIGESALTCQACILVSAWSAGNAYCYVGSRILVAMAVDRQLPSVSSACLRYMFGADKQMFAKVNRWGVPYWAVLVSFAFGPLGYLSKSLGSGVEQC